MDTTMILLLSIGVIFWAYILWERFRPKKYRKFSDKVVITEKDFDVYISNFRLTEKFNNMAIDWDPTMGGYICLTFYLPNTAHKKALEVYSNLDVHFSEWIEDMLTEDEQGKLVEYCTKQVKELVDEVYRANNKNQKKDKNEIEEYIKGVI